MGVEGPSSATWRGAAKIVQDIFEVVVKKGRSGDYGDGAAFQYGPTLPFREDYAFGGVFFQDGERRPLVLYSAHQWRKTPHHSDLILRRQIERSPDFTITIYLPDIAFRSERTSEGRSFVCKAYTEQPPLSIACVLAVLEKDGLSDKYRSLSFQPPYLGKRPFLISYSAFP